MQRMIVMAAALAVCTSAGLSSVATAHDVECVENLRQAPIETVSPPEGWAWDTLSWNYGLWSGSVTISDEDSYELATITIFCSEDPAADMARQREVRDALSQSPSLMVIAIGDESDAFRSSGRPQIVWRKGDVLASLNIDGQADYAAFEAFATAINEALP